MRWETFLSKKFNFFFLSFLKINFITAFILMGKQKKYLLTTCSLIQFLEVWNEIFNFFLWQFIFHFSLQSLYCSTFCAQRTFRLFCISLVRYKCIKICLNNCKIENICFPHFLFLLSIKIRMSNHLCANVLCLQQNKNKYFSYIFEITIILF